VGEAVQHATDALTASLLNAMTGIAPVISESQPYGLSADSAMPVLEGQVASILPNGRIALNVGASAGVAPGDVFEVLEVANVEIDPHTSEVLSYDPIDVKGEVVVTEVRDRVSYAVTTTSFTPAIGDIVRWAGR